MVGTSTLLLAIGAANIASAAALASVSCTLGSGKQTEKLSFDLTYAQNLAKRSPSGKNIHTASNYPHVFQNFDGIKWPNAACNSKKVNVLEFPILEKKGNKDPPDYAWNKKPKQDPGPCRIVYSETDGHFCGIMCHKVRDSSTGNDSDKGFNLCK
ncbi:hypothetical protein BT63DRAFT_457498 [Microthyrium microscopicum]|uniref:Uncharacterized protein n=1 Tax=Microthyrium microscopicum TaxID=703497 RepID=A0A6A6U2N3_9PEZI|nr:hypothetical protein BT63DRAFT_457498 [Microthyrium microscopicum]